MLFFTIKRMLKNKWLTMSMLLGFVLAVAIIVSIPMYSSAILKKILAKDLDNLKQKDNINPGVFTLFKRIDTEEINSFPSLLRSIEGKEENAVKDLGLKIVDRKTEILCRYMSIADIDENGYVKDERGGKYFLKSLTDIEKHIDFAEGKIFSNDFIENDVAEAIVSERTFKQMNLKLDTVYFIKKHDSVEKPLLTKFKISGIYKPKDPEEAYWSDRDFRNTDSIIISDNIMKNKISKYADEKYIDDFNAYIFIDYKDINVAALKNTLNAFNSNKKSLERIKECKITFSSLDVMKTYIEKQSKLNSTLLAIEIPIILLIMIYITMVSKIVINSTSNEVSVLKSRGFNNFKIFRIYFGQNLIISLIGLILGCGLSVFFCKLIGSANGFLKFTRRDPLSISLGKSELIYSLILMAGFLIITSIPVLISTNGSIVLNKRKNVRKRKPIIERFYLDFIMFGLSVYLIYNQKTVYKILNISTSGQGSTIPPVMYINFTLFSIGLALICLRLYPYLLKLILLTGKKRWSPEAYAALVNVGRNRDNNFLIIFIVITLSTGIFNLKSASTINQYEESKVRYTLGTDIVVRPWWLRNDLDILQATGPVKSTNEAQDVTFYKEPDISGYYSIDGIESTTKVFKNNTGKLMFKDNVLVGNSQIIGIIPDEFGKTAWFDPEFLQYHWYHYLNFLSKDPKGVLLSKDQQKNNIKLGDTVYIRWEGTLYMECHVYGFLDYWPSYDKTNKQASSFAVCNLNYLSTFYSTHPYEIWMKKSNKVDNATLYKNIENKNLSYENLKTIDQLMYDLKTDPMIQGMNGTLSLCFIASLMITCMGFIIYWTLSIKSRTLQFGILRAIGLKVKKLIFMLIYEQGLTSGVAILMGMVIGQVSSNIFIPMLNNTKKADQIIPFIIRSFNNAYVNLILFMLALLIVSLFILIKIIKKININQALKLGED